MKSSSIRGHFFFSFNLTNVIAQVEKICRKTIPPLYRVAICAPFGCKGDEPVGMPQYCEAKILINETNECISLTYNGSKNNSSEKFFAPF